MEDRKQELDGFASAYVPDAPYALDNGLILSWYPERILDRSRGRSLLELGLGHGFTTPVFAQHFERHVVLEGSKAVIDQFQAQHPSVSATICQTYFEDFRTDERFDVIVMGFILEHVDDPHAMMRRYRELLNPGGVIYLAVPNGEALNRRIGHAAGMMDDMMALGSADREQGHQRLFTLSSLRDLVASAELREKWTEGLFLKAITTSQIQKLALAESVLKGMLEVGVDYPELCVAMLMAVGLPE